MSECSTLNRYRYSIHNDSSTTQAIWGLCGCAPHYSSIEKPDDLIEKPDDYFPRGHSFPQVRNSDFFSTIATPVGASRVVDYVPPAGKSEKKAVALAVVSFALRSRRSLSGAHPHSRIWWMTSFCIFLFSPGSL